MSTATVPLMKNLFVCRKICTENMHTTYCRFYEFKRKLKSGVLPRVTLLVIVWENILFPMINYYQTSNKMDSRFCISKIYWNLQKVACAPRDSNPFLNVGTELQPRSLGSMQKGQTINIYIFTCTFMNSTPQ